MTFSTRGQQMHPIQIGTATYAPPANGQQKYLGFVCESNLKGTAHAQQSIAKAKAKLAMSASVGRKLGHHIGHMYVKTHIMPHVLYANEFVVEKINENFDLSPRGIREMLNLNKPIYEKTAAYGHFGRVPEDNGSFSWEKTDKISIFFR